MTTTGIALPSLQALESAHLRLMGSYLTTANDATRLPVLLVTRRWCEINRPTLGKPPWLVLGFATKLFVESHLKRKLKELTDAYVQLESALSIVGDREYRDWLRQVRDSMAAFRGSLSSVHRLRLTLGALWPALTGILGGVGLQVSFPGSIDPVVLLLIALVVLIDLGPYLYLFLRSSFLVKRELLLPGARLLERQPRETQRKLGGQVYEVEDKLFQLLGRAKKKEVPVDAAGLFAVLIVPGALLVVALARLFHLGDSIWTFLIGSLVFVGIIMRPVWIVARREWR